MTPNKFYDYDCTKPGRVKNLKIRLTKGIEFVMSLGVYLLTFTCVGIHPVRVEPASPIALTTSRTEAFQAT